MSLDFFQVELEQSFSLAIPLERTAEVLALQWSELCPIPGITQALLGISNQRGRLLWMLDLGTLLGLSTGQTPLSSFDKSTAIVFTQEGLRVAAVVRALKGIISLNSQEIQPHDHPCLLGQATLANAPLPILDVDAVFTFLQEPTAVTPALV